MNKYSLQILLSILIVNGILLCFALLGPEITIVSPFDGEEIVISFPDVKESLFKSAQQNNENAENFLSKYDDSDEPQPEEAAKEDTIGYLINPEYREGRALDSFFESLAEESSRTTVRIAHYGDSQIEGDRITTHIRELFQEKFGGQGIGYVPVDDITDNVNYYRSTSENWERFNVFNNAYKSGKYSLSGLVFRYGNGKSKNKEEEKKGNEGKEVDQDPGQDPAIETPPDSTVTGGVRSIYLADSYNFYRRAYVPASETRAAMLRGSVSLNLSSKVRFSNIKIFYGNTGDDSEVRISDQKSGTEITTLQLTESKPFGLQKVQFAGSGNTLRFDFRTGVNPEIYGFFIDGEKGVQVDNFAIRGHSGDGLLKIDRKFLEQQYDKLNVKLIILQYGMNVMPTVKKEKDLERVRKYYIELFSGMRKRVNGASILVIGPGDMGVIRRGSNVSHPYIGKVVEIIKQAAIENGCAFWNTYELMGGENSIMTWAQKGFAARDGHFINRGQKIIAGEMFKGLMDSYKNFNERKNKRS